MHRGVHAREHSWQPSGTADPPNRCVFGLATRVSIAPGRNRTCDLALRRRALYPLSYRRWRVVVYPRAAERPDRRPGAGRDVRRSPAARRTRPRWSRSRSGTATSRASERLRRSTATASRPNRRSRTSRVSRATSATIPFALDEVLGSACRPSEYAAPRRDRRRTARPLRQARRRAGLAAPRARAARAADILDDRARGRPTRWREKAAKAHATGRFRRLKLKLGGRRRPRRRTACARCARSRTFRSRWT